MGPHPAVAQVRLAVRRCLSGAGLAPGDLVLAACSGGADSLALASALAFEAPRLGLRGGGVTVDGVVAACLAALAAGGRLVANAVTLEGESVLADWLRRRGGTLTRIGVERAGQLGSFTTWRPALPVVQWSIVKENS